MIKGHNTVIWYFVWPTCSRQGHGYVREQDFFNFCQAMERVPIRTGWPHESSLYRILCGKLWVPQMCLNRVYRVPPTTRVHYAEFKRDPAMAVIRALEALMRLRQRVWGKAPVPFQD